MKFQRKIGTTLAASLLLTTTAMGTAFASGTPDSQASSNVSVTGNTKNPKNIIFMVGDGMGPSYNSAYRHFADNPDTQEIEETAFDQYLKGQQKTDPKDAKENVTDSAAGATAFSTGVKTYNGAISVDTNKKKVKSVLEQAKENGKSTGLVATSEITDATPAAYAAHVDSRDKKDEIAQQFYNQKINGQHTVDVLLGGGDKYFGESNGNLKQKFAKDGYDVVDNKNALLNSQSDQVLGLFSEENMPLQIDAPNDDPKLAEMQSVALQKLEQNDKGFFLMVEGSSIDKSGHPNDITGVMSEMSGFEDAFKQATNYAKSHPDTLVVATADHSTGGLTIGKGEDYLWDPKPIHQMKHSGSYMTTQIAEGKDIQTVIQEGYGFDVDNNTIKSIEKQAKKLSKLSEDDDAYEKQYQALQDAIQKPINDKSHTGWTTTGHTGEDVNSYAFGPGSDNYRGVIENTDNANFIFNFLQSEK
ncbi:alkaline phosphatase [Mammaliicoccus sp. Dog046]|uniref:alkaline phosphatase n=1 Tax=Mammaliicoccus sp. Dog046 TaxID=3034233 RepID=UPI002B25936C|nr:alkaline phosphatase [Mammaliicoccus sp. Dog046]WQK86577.1 alkaline phosphatase [Mammaliicoccus sp. Dog046]